MIVSPDVQKILRKAAREISPSLSPSSSTEEFDLNKELEYQGLSVSETLERVKHIMDSAESDQTRLAAAQIALKLAGVMKENSTPSAPVTFIIKDPYGGELPINPILLPRQLLSSLPSSTLEVTDGSL